MKKYFYKLRGGKFIDWRKSNLFDETQDIIGGPNA